MQPDAPGWIQGLPALNAVLNTLSTVLLLIGYALIRQRRVEAHRRAMIAAFAGSTLFIISYLTYHAFAGATSFGHEGTLVRTVYFGILLPHTVLATVTAPLAVTVLVLALTDRIDRHRRLARITLPLWLFVSVTGVVIYVMLYHAPGAAG